MRWRDADACKRDRECKEDGGYLFHNFKKKILRPKLKF
jgi:hypothetical protein